MSSKPAELLKGLSLDGGWTVVEGPLGPSGSSGGNFSFGYIVERPDGDPRRAFLKAIDLSRARDMPGPLLDSLKALTNEAAHERDLVMDCASRRMRNVVHGLAAGEAKVADPRMDPGLALVSDVPYIIFEVADHDVRAVVEAVFPTLDHAWSLRMMHGAANGLRQMHDADMAHQDVKPSNVMTVAGKGKLGDLGRSSPPGGGGIFDGHSFAGDMRYAPPELLYRHILPDDRARRRSADLYQLGSLLAFMFTGAVFTGAWASRLDPVFSSRTWPNDYLNVMPYVRQAFDEAVRDVEGSFPAIARDGLSQTLRELCDPDPQVRGNPRRSSLHRYGLDVYVSRFDRYARMTEASLSSSGVK